MCYSNKIEEEVFYWSADWVVTYKNLGTMEKPVGNSQKWSRSFTGAVAYESVWLKSLRDESNGVSQSRS